LTFRAFLGEIGGVARRPLEISETLGPLVAG